METLGAYLKQARSSRGVTLRELANVTRVSLGALEALEAEDLHALPAPAYTKGFIRAYMSYCQMPPDEALALYSQMVEEGEKQKEGNSSSLAFRDLYSHMVEEGAKQAPGELLPKYPQKTLRYGIWSSPLALGLVIIAALSLILALFQGRWSQDRPDVARLSPPSLKSEPSQTPSGSLSKPEPFTKAAKPEQMKGARTTVARKEGPTSGGLVLTARTSETTWIRVDTDEGLSVQELLPPEATRQWKAREQFVLTIGNAGGISLELNGQPVGPLGKSGEVIRRLVLPRQTGSKEATLP